MRLVCIPDGDQRGSNSGLTYVLKMRLVSSHLVNIELMKSEIDQVGYNTTRDSS